TLGMHLVERMANRADASEGAIELPQLRHPAGQLAEAALVEHLRERRAAMRAHRALACKRRGQLRVRRHTAREVAYRVADARVVPRAVLKVAHSRSARSVLGSILQAPRRDAAASLFARSDAHRSCTAETLGNAGGRPRRGLRHVLTCGQPNKNTEISSCTD